MELECCLWLYKKDFRKQNWLTLQIEFQPVLFLNKKEAGEMCQ